jgi:serine/threonine protein kinase
MMEYVNGETLHKRIRSTQLIPIDTAIEIVRQIADALASVHKCGIIHRDLKPDNILLVPDSATAFGERVKVLDFGIAKLHDPTKDSHTRTGAVMGTPAYMAPEQCRGVRTIDHRADLYSLGCIMFELMCGRKPFVAAAHGDLMIMHVAAPLPSPVDMNPLIPDEVARIITKLLQKEPPARFVDAPELVAALDRLDVGQRQTSTSRLSLPYATPQSTTLSQASAQVAATEIVTRQPPNPLARWGPFIAVLVAAGAIGTAFVWWQLEPSSTEETRGLHRSTAPLPRQEDAGPAPRPNRDDPKQELIKIHVATQPPGADQERGVVSLAIP